MPPGTDAGNEVVHSGRDHSQTNLPRSQQPESGAGIWCVLSLSKQPDAGLLLLDVARIEPKTGVEEVAPRFLSPAAKGALPL